MSLNSIGSLWNLAPQQTAAIFQLQRLNQDIGVNLERLATQNRINSAADDPAGFVLASSLQLELSSLAAASAVATTTQLYVASSLDVVQGVDVATVSSQLASDQLLQQSTIMALRMFNTQRQNLVNLLLGPTSKT
jgi:flagellin-like hook-associated protein FlgL